MVFESGFPVAGMAELADAYGLGPYTARCGGSSPSARIISLKTIIHKIRGNKWRKKTKKLILNPLLWTNGYAL